MAGELGETKNPKGLIPGDTGKLEVVARSLRKNSARFESVARQLGAVRIPGWTGKACDEFWDNFSGEKKNWLYAADAMADAASALSGYAATLSGAQQKAAEAIALWDAGDEAEAQSILETARRHVREEGESAAKKLDDASGGASGTPTWLARAGEIAEQQKESGKTSVGLRDLYESNPLTDQRKRYFGAAGPENPNAQNSRASEVNLWGRKAEASVWDAKADGESQFGDHGKLSGKAGVKLLGVDGAVGASVTDGNLQARAGASAYLAKATAEGGVEYGPAAAKVDGSAFVGADASARASVGKSGAHLGAEAFAGARATASGHADVGGIGAGVTAEGWAGAGAAANLDVGAKDGKFVIGGELGVGLGLGGKVGTQIEIDPGKVADTVGDVGDAVGDGLDAVGDGLSSLSPFG